VDYTAKRVKVSAMETTPRQIQNAQTLRNSDWIAAQG
jgi:hypothetical protein